jgi:hypothetical protein
MLTNVYVLLWRKLFVVWYILWQDSLTEMLNLCKFKAMFSTDMSYVSILKKRMNKERR